MKTVQLMSSDYDLNSVSMIGEGLLRIFGRFGEENMSLDIRLVLDFVLLYQFVLLLST